MLVHTVFSCLITIVHKVTSLNDHLSFTCLDFALGFVIYASNILTLVSLMEVITATSLHLQGPTNSWSSNTTQKLCVRWTLTSGALHSSLVIQLLLTTILLEHHFVLLLHLHLLKTHLAWVTTALIILHHVDSSYVVVIFIYGFLSILFNHVIIVVILVLLLLHLNAIIVIVWRLHHRLLIMYIRNILFATITC